VEAGKAEGWLEKLKRRRVLKEGWPKYKVSVVKGALVVRSIEIVCGREHLEDFKRYAELANAIERWLEETGR
jgi:hypothetical protein